MEGKWVKGRLCRWQEGSALRGAGGWERRGKVFRWLRRKRWGGKFSRLYVSETQGHQVCGVRSEGGKEEVNGKVNGVQEEVRGKVSRGEKEVRGKVSRLYVSEAQGHLVCGTRSEGGMEEVRCKVNGVQEKMRGKVIRWWEGGERQGQQTVHKWGARSSGLRGKVRRW
jgi:hypothetical protein